MWGWPRTADENASLRHMPIQLRVRMLAMLTHDLRDAARNLRRKRGVAASAISILAIGIAASTGLFAVVDAVVLHPLPYAGADRPGRGQLLPPSRPARSASARRPRWPPRT